MLCFNIIYLGINNIILKKALFIFLLELFQVYQVASYFKYSKFVLHSSHVF